MEHDTTAKDPEEETKHAMEIAGAPSLRRRWRAPKSLWIPEIVEQVTNYMFVATPELATYGAAASAASSPNNRILLVLQPRYLKLSFPIYDGKEDPLSWLNYCEQFFRGQCTPNDEKVWYLLFSSDKWSTTVVHAPDPGQGSE